MNKIILRVDFNVPRSSDYKKILDTSKIDKLLPEIKKLTKNNTITILSHLGKGNLKTDSLKIVDKYLRSKLNKNENKKIIIHENIRFLSGETAKPNSSAWNKVVKYYGTLGNIYIDDAFPVMHRDQASITGLPKLFKSEHKKVTIGNYSKKEIIYLNKSLALAKNKNIETLLILSGIKTKTKLPLIKKFLDLGNKVAVGGGNANQMLKEVMRYSIGKSYFDKSYVLSKKEVDYFKKKIAEKKLILPIDVILKNQKIELTNKLKTTDYISDIGPATLAMINQEIKKAKNIIMNGPLGFYQFGFDKSTINILKNLEKQSKNKNILIGGGDTLVLVKKIRLKENKNLHISLAGGAMLEFLTKDGQLPGIIAIK